MPLQYSNLYSVPTVNAAVMLVGVRSTYVNAMTGYSECTSLRSHSA
jgi:hypothetical protein